jgi:hypothetical protein
MDDIGTSIEGMNSIVREGGNECILLTTCRLKRSFYVPLSIAVIQYRLPIVG